MPITGFVDEVTRSRVRGWVCDPERPGEALWVTIRVNDREVARCSADRHRSVLRQRIGDGNHEFCFDFEPPLSVFEEFAIEVAVAGSTELLQGGTKILPAPQLAKTPGQLIPILLTSTGRAGTTLLMHEFLRHPELLVAGSYPFEMKLINYYAAAFRALAGNEDRVHSTDPDHMFAEQNRKLIGHNPYNSPGNRLRRSWSALVTHRRSGHPAVLAAGSSSSSGRLATATAIYVRAGRIPHPASPGP